MILYKFRHSFEIENLYNAEQEGDRALNAFHDSLSDVHAKVRVRKDIENQIRMHGIHHGDMRERLDAAVSDEKRAIRNSDAAAVWNQKTVLNTQEAMKSVEKAVERETQARIDASRADI